MEQLNGYSNAVNTPVRTSGYQRESSLTKTTLAAQGVRQSSWRRSGQESPREVYTGSGRQTPIGVLRNGKLSGNNTNANNNVYFRVERTDSASCLAVGDVVGYEFVSEDGKWTWSIGTVLASGDNNGNNIIANYNYDDPMNSDPSLVPLACWEIALDSQAERKGSHTANKVNKHEDYSLHIRRRLDEIEEEKIALSRDHYAEDVLRAEKKADTARETMRVAVQEQRSMLRLTQRPQNAFLLAVEAVFSLLHIELLVKRKEEEWDHMRRVLCSDSFDRHLANREAYRLDDTQYDYITQRYLNNPLFSFAEVNACSELAVLMHKWVLREVKLYEARAVLQSVDDRMEELKEEAKQKERELRRHLDPNVNLRTCTDQDDGGDVRSALQSFQDLGQVSFVLGDETLSVLRSSIFCKFVTSISSPLSAFTSMTIQRDRLARIRSAASGKQRRVKFGSPISDASTQESKVLVTRDMTQQTRLAYEQSLERERLMLRELEVLYDRHVRYTTAQHRLLCESISPRVHSNTRNRSDAMKLTEAQDKVRELEEALRKKENAIRVMQSNHDKSLRQLQENLRTNSIGVTRRLSDEVSVTRFQQFRIHFDEEVERMQLSGTEARHWSLLLLMELRVSKDIIIDEMRDQFAKRIYSVREELSDRERCQKKAVTVLQESLEADDEEKDDHKRHKRQRRAVKHALKTLAGSGSSRSPEMSPNRHSQDQSPSRNTSPRRLPARSGTPGRRASMSEANSSFKEIDEENTVILQDRLIEAVRDRELIQDMLLQEQRKNKLLEDEREALRSDLNQEVERHAKLEEMIRRLQEEIASLRESKRSMTDEYTREVSERDNTEAREQIARLRSIAASYDKQLEELLVEEGIWSEEASFQNVRECIANLKASCAAMREERDAHAADAKMLESCLKTAADALEDALLHDERWQPRTTNSDHTTWHCKKFAGDDWSRVISDTPEALEKALVHDIAAACHLPEDYLLNLTYHAEGEALRVSFDLRHDPTITSEEIASRLDECNYYQLEKLYACRFSPEEGIDTLKRKLRMKEEELKELRETVTRLRDNKRYPGARNKDSYLVGL